MLRFRGKVTRAHRVAIALRRSIPKGMMVLHHCDNPACVNVRHLYLGTQADNMRDMVVRGRASRHGGTGGRPPLMYGSDHPRSKLTSAQVDAIRADTRSLRVIGKAFGVSSVHVLHIKQRKVRLHG